MFTLSVVEVSSASEEHQYGYGRDAEEAIANSGWMGEPEDMVIRDVTVADDPRSPESKRIARAICDVYLGPEDVLEEMPVPASVLNGLRALMAIGEYASAVEYCFELIWDRAWENC